MRKDHLFGILGLSFVVAFFLPLARGGEISGLDVVLHGTLWWKLAFLALPLAGAAIASLAFSGKTRQASNLAMITGVGVFGLIAYEILWGILSAAGIGMWIILGASIVGITAGAASSKK